MRLSILGTSASALLPAAFLAAGFVLAPSLAQAQSTSFKETFNNNALPTTLEQLESSPNYSGGVVTFPASERRYLQTVANYNTTNFIAEVTVTVSSGYGGSGMGFFGLGSGIASYFYGEPRLSPTTYARIAPNDFYSGFVAITTSSAESIGNIYDAAGDGTHRVRITWNHVTKTFTVAIQKNYAGGPFTPGSTIVLTPDNENFGDTNSRIFFGGAGNSVFDDLLVLALDGTAGAIDCHGKSVSGIVRQFGNTNNAVSSLGFASVDALQQMITGFCGN
ncbi:MAG: hypothetical protein HYX27_16025 [Acidobacteria bacterium]|nr:hypothetical protein [Acidobacteriota bacterium]